MTPDGEIAPPVAAAASWPVRLGVAALVVAVFAGLAASAMIFLWLASVLIPVALVAGCIAYGAFRFQLWRLRGRTGAAPPPWVFVNKR